MAVETIQEFQDSRGIKLQTDRETGVIRGVKLLGNTSRNGRTYPKQTIANAVKLYEGAKVNLNHIEGRTDRPRQYQDRLGSIRTVRVAPGNDGLFGDFHFNPKHPIAEQLLWDAENAPENVGFSHNIVAKASRLPGGKVVVEEITRVQSVDLVADPATTKGLFEDAHSPESEEGNNMPVTLESLQAEQPDLLKSIGEKAIKEHVNSETVKTAAAEKDATIKEQAEKLDAFEAKEKLATHKEAVDKELTEAKLPEQLLSDTFRTSLYEAKDADARKALIEDRQAIGKKVGTSTPQSKEQGVTEGGGEAADYDKVVDGKSFAAAIRG